MPVPGCRKRIPATEPTGNLATDPASCNKPSPSGMPPGARNAWFRTLWAARPGCLGRASWLAIGLLLWQAVARDPRRARRGRLALLEAARRAAAADRAPAHRPAGGRRRGTNSTACSIAASRMRARKRRLLDMLRAYRAAAAPARRHRHRRPRQPARAVVQRGRGARLLGLATRATSTARSAIACSRCRCRGWLAAGRNAEPMLDAVSPTDPAIRLDLRLIPYSDQLWLLVARRDQADAAGGSAPRFRRQRLARTAHAADRRARLPRHARTRGQARAGRRCWTKCAGSRSA